MSRTFSDLRLRALLTGAMLGALVWAMARARPGDDFALLMALVLLASGSASFVCHALSLQPATRAARSPIGGWLLRLGAGVLASLAGLSAWPG